MCVTRTGNRRSWNVLRIASRASRLACIKARTEGGKRGGVGKRDAPERWSFAGMICEGGRAECHILRRTSVGSSGKGVKDDTTPKEGIFGRFPIGELIVVAKEYSEKGTALFGAAFGRQWRRRAIAWRMGRIAVLMPPIILHIISESKAKEVEMILLGHDIKKQNIIVALC